MIQIQGTPKQEIKKVFKSFKDLDIEIRTIEKQTFKDNSVYLCVEIGLLESLGEQGDIINFDYDEKPTEEEILKDTLAYLVEYKKELNEKLLTNREEEHLKTLNKIKDLK